MDDQNRRSEHGRRRPMDDQNWSEQLPDELLEMIVKRLTLVDSIRFAAVCPCWRRVSSQWFQRVTRLPWLLTSVRFLDYLNTTVIYSFYSPSEDTIYDLKFPRESLPLRNDDAEIFCSGSIDGWLIMWEWIREKWTNVRTWTFINYFLNPITGDRIKLPELVGDKVPCISTASSNPRCSDCVVILLLSSHLVFCKPSSDKSWHYWNWGKERQDYCMNYIKFHEDGKLYVSDIAKVYDTQRFEIFVLVLECQSKGDEGCEKITVYREKTIYDGGFPPMSCYCLPSLFWSSKGELLLVRDDEFSSSRQIHVLKRDAKSGHNNPIWVNLETDDIAEDEVVLVSSTNSTSVAKSRSNSVLNTIDEAFLQLWCGKFFTCPENFRPRSSFPRGGVWITPNTTK